MNYKVPRKLASNSRTLLPTLDRSSTCFGRSGYLVRPELEVQRAGDGEVSHLEEDDPDHQEDEDDVHARDEVGVDDVVAGALLSHGVHEATVRLTQNRTKQSETKTSKDACTHALALRLRVELASMPSPSPPPLYLDW